MCGGHEVPHAREPAVGSISNDSLHCGGSRPCSPHAAPTPPSQGQTEKVPEPGHSCPMRDSPRDARRTTLQPEASHTHVLQPLLSCSFLSGRTYILAWNFSPHSCSNKSLLRIIQSWCPLLRDLNKHNTECVVKRNNTFCL